MSLPRGAGRGGVGEDRALHEDYVGNGRVRCLLCFRKWEAESIAVEVSRGLCEADAKKVVSESAPPSAFVPTYNKSSPDNLRRHLQQSHSDEVTFVLPKKAPGTGVLGAGEASLQPASQSAGSRVLHEPFRSLCTCIRRPMSSLPMGTVRTCWNTPPAYPIVRGWYSTLLLAAFFVASNVGQKVR